MEKQTQINGYLVEFSSEYDGDDLVTDCWVTKGAFSSSLAYLCDNGSLHAAEYDDNDKPVSERIIDKIEEWALDQGY